FVIRLESARLNNESKNFFLFSSKEERFIFSTIISDLDFGSPVKIFSSLLNLLKNSSSCLTEKIYLKESSWLVIVSWAKEGNGKRKIKKKRNKNLIWK